VIVNGSNPTVITPVIVHSSSAAKAQVDEAVHGLGLEANEQKTIPQSQSQPLETLTSPVVANGQAEDHLLASAVVEPTNGMASVGEVAHASSKQISPRLSPNGRAKAPARLNLSPTDSNQQETPLAYFDRFTDVAPMIAPPILSPVAELRTPSPTSSKGQISPKVESHIKTAQVANAKLNERANSIIANGATRLEPSQNKPLNSEAGNASNHTASVVNSQAGQWQQATRKGHKKGKSTSTVKASSSPKAGGEPMPANELERKGG